MNAKTVGVLAALGMLVSSLSVWSLTDKRVRPKPSPVETAATPSDPSAQPAASFVRDGVLRIEGRLGRSRLDAAAPGETYLFANVSAGERDAGTAAPLNLAVVIDRSGSMKGKRLVNALEAARGMIRRLRDGDVLSIITYNTQTETVLPPTSIDAVSRERAIGSLGGVTAGGDTCISCGIDAGMAALRQRSGMITRMLLLSDGEATAGVRDIDGFRRIAATARAMGCPVSSIGVDLEYNERVLAALALDSNGQHYFAENSADLQRAFDRELAQLVRTLAKDAEIQVDLAPGVEVEKVFDRSFRQDGQKLVVRMGTFSAGEQKTLLVKVRVPKAAPGDVSLANMTLSFADPDGRHQEMSGKLDASLVTSGAQNEIDPVVSARLGRTETADAIEEANQLFNAGDVTGANQRLEQTRSRLAQTKSEALKSAPAPAASAIGGDFQHQSDELENAEKRFKDAPTTAGKKPQATPEGKSGTKRNAEAVNPFRF